MGHHRCKGRRRWLEGMQALEHPSFRTEHRRRKGYHLRQRLEEMQALENPSFLKERRRHTGFRLEGRRELSRRMAREVHLRVCGFLHHSRRFPRRPHPEHRRTNRRLSCLHGFLSYCLPCLPCPPCTRLMGQTGQTETPM